MKTVIAAALLVFAFGASLPFAQGNPEVDFANANKALERESFDVAIALYSAVLEAHPDAAEALNGRGVAYARSERHQRAVNDFTAALALKPESFDAVYNRGLAYRALEINDKAIVDFTKAIEMRPEDPAPLLHRGLLYFKEGDFDLAGPDLWDGIALSFQSDD